MNRWPFGNFNLVDMLNYADISEQERMYLSDLAKYAISEDDYELQMEIGEYLMWHIDITPVFRQGGGEPEFFLGSHVALYGPPRVGKTFLIMKEIVRIKRERNDVAAILIPDFEGDYSRILPSLLKPGEELLVINLKKNRKNVFENIEQSEEWTDTFPKPFIESGWFSDASYMLMCLAARMLREAGRMPGPNGYPSFDELFNTMVTAPVSHPALKESQAKASFRIEYYKNSAVGHIFNNHRGYHPGQLAGKVIVYDYSKLDPMSQVLMISHEMLDAVFKSENQAYGPGRVVFVAEEIHRLYRSSLMRREPLFEPTFLDVSRSGHKRGLTCIWTDHSISLSPLDILIGSDTKAIFRLNSKEDISLAASAFMLKHDLAEKLADLENQHCLFTVSGQGEKASLYRVPDLDFHLYSNEEVEEMMAPHIAKLDYVPVDGARMIGAESAGLQLWLERNMRRVRSFLEELAKHPLKSVGIIGRKLPFEVDEAFVRRMADAALIMYPEKLTFGRAGGSKGLSKHYTAILPGGAALLSLSYEDLALPSGKNKSLQARVAVNSIHRQRRDEGAVVEMEWHGADVVEMAGDSLFCYEYETQVHPHIITNVKRDLHEIGASAVFIVMDTKSQLKEAGEILRPEFSDADFKKVSFRQTKEYL